MATVKALYVFLTKSLWISEPVLGRSLSFVRAGREISIDLPANQMDFQIHPGLGRVAIQGFAYPVGPEKSIATPVGAIRIGVLGHLDVPAPAALEGYNPGSFGPVILPISRFWSEALPIAHSACAEFMDHVRVRFGQCWLGLHGQRYELGAHGKVSHLESGEEYPIASSVGMSGLHSEPGGERSIDTEDLANIECALAGATEMPCPDLLLADALAHACVDPPDYTRGILLAAIACETKIKQALQQSAPESSRDLLRIVIDNPRDVSVAAVVLFHTVAKATVGRSLQEEQPRLYKRVEDLFKRRNRLAHKGYAPEADSLDLIRAAREVFQWIGTLERRASHNQG